MTTSLSVSYVVRYGGSGHGYFVVPVTVDEGRDEATPRLIFSFGPAAAGPYTTREAAQAEADRLTAKAGAQ